MLVENPTESFLSLLFTHLKKTAANGATDPSGLQYLLQRFMKHHENTSNRNYLLTRLLAAYTRRDAASLTLKNPQDYIEPGLANLKEIPLVGEALFQWICTEVVVID
jgi:hypothetical protein